MEKDFCKMGNQLMMPDGKSELVLFLFVFTWDDGPGGHFCLSSPCSLYNPCLFKVLIFFIVTDCLCKSFHVLFI